jgi:hypothetical protein
MTVLKATTLPARCKSKFRNEIHSERGTNSKRASHALPTSLADLVEAVQNCPDLIPKVKAEVLRLIRQANAK